MPPWPLPRGARSPGPPGICRDCARCSAAAGHVRQEAGAGGSTGPVPLDASTAAAPLWTTTQPEGGEGDDPPDHLARQAAEAPQCIVKLRHSWHVPANGAPRQPRRRRGAAACWPATSAITRQPCRSRTGNARSSLPGLPRPAGLQPLVQRYMLSIWLHVQCRRRPS